MSDHESRRFWGDVFSWRDSIPPQVHVRVAAFVAFSAVVCAVELNQNMPTVGIEAGPYEFAGAVLGLLLVLRTNAGYDRWWEGRRLWGGIVNQCRDLAIGALAYGPPDPHWRSAIVRWTAAFAHVARRSLRGERTLPEVAVLLGDDQARRVAGAEHMPSFVLREIADRLRQARDRQGMDPFAFLQADRARATLTDHLGGCERILNAPLPRVYSVQICRFIALYLATLPFPLATNVGWYTPLIMLLVTYPVLLLDEIGFELQNPFSTRRMGHLPLDELTAKIEANLLAMLRDEPGATAEEGARPAGEVDNDGRGQPGAAALGDAPATA
jgi:putative membrane protein